jgi:nitric oxide reductase NorD protein
MTVNAMQDTPANGQSLYAIKGVLTKFMRMLFPLEFRVDSVADCGAILPFHYPLLAGEMIHLPERVTALGKPENAHDYYMVTAAHLAARHEFGTFSLRLGQLAGFERRGETGVEALDGFVSSFPDPGLAGAIFRLCEAARIDAELCRRYRGLGPRVARLNRLLVATLRPDALSTLLVRASLALDEGGFSFIHRAAEFFAPLRAPGADVAMSARQTRAMYEWLRDLIARARLMGEDDSINRDAAHLRDDLIGTEKRAGAQDGEPDGEADAGTDGGETDQSVQLQSSGKRSGDGQGRALSPEEIRKLIEQGAQIKPSEGSGDADGDGMYLTQLLDKQAKELDQLREQLGEIGPSGAQGRLVIGRGRTQDLYYAYDEWDYMLADYRRSWCRLREVPVAGDDGQFFANTLDRYSELLPMVRRHFQRIRPASYRMVRGLEDGDEIDLERTVEMKVSRRMGEMPDPRIYRARKKEARDVATLFLLDMSASTDEPIYRETRKYSDTDDADDWAKAWERSAHKTERPRRIIDVNKEALVIMAQALEELGDYYAIMGFSGHGRDNVEFYVIKEFDHELSDEVKGRVGAVEPKRSTRMGTAIRHVREKFKDVTCRSRHVILLSDGFPQDFDYGHDRRSNVYGVQDTMVALKELEAAGVIPFCITVDRTGHDYLREMCTASRYLIIEDIASLPRQLPKIYEQVVRW